MSDVRPAVNGTVSPVPAGTTVAELVRRALAGERSPAGVAAALNGEVVPRSRWDATPVGDGDRLELLEAAQGG